MPTPNLPEIVSEKGIETGNFYRDAVIIDKDCNRYKVIGFEILGLHRDIWNMYGLSKRKIYYYRLLIDKDNIEKLTFSKARSQIVEHCISRRWSNQTGAKPAEFRAHHEKKLTIEDVMTDIGLLGKFPF